MHCGTAVDAQQEPEVEIPSVEEPAFEAPVAEEPVFVPSELPAPDFDLPKEVTPEAEPITFQALKITIDP